MSDRLVVRDLTVSVAETVLLEGVSADVGPGELVAVAGPSGVGKTTLLRAIAGLIDPTGGTVALGGRSPEEIGWPRFRRRVVLVAQQPVLLEGTLRESLERPFAYRSAGRAFPAERAAALLERLGVAPDRLDQEARSLSVGQQQRAALVRALLVEPDVLLLDEPTSALDADAAAAVETLLRDETRRTKLAALVVTHDEEQAARLCDRSLSLATFVPAGALRG